MAGENINWPELVFDPDFMAGINRLAFKRFGDDTLGEECASAVLDGLADNDWARCKAFQGKSKPTTFLYTLVNNQIEEFARRKFGRPRPPTWLKNQGDMWVSLWKALCLERQMVQSVVDRFCQNGLRTIEVVEHAIKVIKARFPNCGQAGFREQSSDMIEDWSDSAGMASDGPQGSMQKEAGILSTLRVSMESLMSDRPSELDPLEDEALSDEGDSEEIQNLKSALTLTDNERALLKMVYVDGLSKQKAAVAIGLPAHQGGRIANDALKRIQEAMQSCGMDLGTLMNALT